MRSAHPADIACMLDCCRSVGPLSEVLDHYARGADPRSRLELLTDEIRSILGSFGTNGEMSWRKLKP